MTRTLVPIAALVVLVFAAFFPALDAGFVNYDDPTAILENAAIEGPSLANARTIFGGLRDEAWLPLWDASYWIDWSLSGRDPATFHLVNLILHAICAALTFLLLRAALRDGAAAFGAAALFATAPALAESVVWASGRKDLLALALALGALLAYLRGLRRGSTGWAIGGALLLGAGMMAKATVAPTPLVAAAMLHLERRRESGADRPAPAPARLGLALLAVVGVEMAAFHLAVAGRAGTADLGLAGSAGRALGAVAVEGPGLLARALGMLGVLGDYAQHLLVPYGLSVHHRVVFDGAFGVDQIHGLVVLAVLGFGVASFVRRPGPIGFGLVWTAAMLLPFNGIVPRSTVPLADRYLHAVAPGVFLALSALLLRLTPPHRRRLLALPLAAALVVAILVARERAEVWHDSETLWRDAIAKDEQAFLPRLQLGAALETAALSGARGPREAPAALAEALDAYRAAARLAADPVQAIQARLKLAPALARSGRFEEALSVDDDLRRRLAEVDVRLPAADRDSLDVTRASALIALGRRDEARTLLARVQDDPSMAVEARNLEAFIVIVEANEALAAAADDEARRAARAAFDRGIAMYRAILAEHPRHEKTRVELVRALAAASWRRDALIELSREALALVEDFPASAAARYLRARAYLEVDPALAEADLVVAIGLDPLREEAWLLRADLLRAQGRNKEAVAVLVTAKETLPHSEAVTRDLAATWLAFAWHHRNTRQPGLALDAVLRSLDLVPDSVDALVLRGELEAEAARTQGTPQDEAGRARERSRAAFERALALAPNSLEARAGLADYHLARGYAGLYAASRGEARDAEHEAERARLRATAMEDFARAAALAPGDPRFAGAMTHVRGYADERRRLAARAFDAGDDDEAQALVEDALRLHPADVEALALLGRIARRRLADGEARAAYGRALEIDPEHLRSLFELAHLELDAGDWARARTLYLRFVAVAIAGGFEDDLKPQIASARRLAEACAERIAAAGEGG